MSDPASAVLNLGAARASRAAEAERRASLRCLVVAVSCIAVLPPGADPEAPSEAVMLDAADLVSDSGRLGEIARAMVARVEAAQIQRAR